MHETITELINDFHGRALPELNPRRLQPPRLPGKIATALDTARQLATEAGLIHVEPAWRWLLTYPSQLPAG